MYILNVVVKDSDINGKGVFAREHVSLGTRVWQY